MGEINIFNYEVFYLDFLEGKLSEESTALLFDFLEEYPELIIDNEPLPILEKASFLLTEELKNDLKQYTEDDVITHANVEHFFIAEQEGLLTDLKKLELEKIVAREGLEAEAAVYKSVYLKADLSIIYADKNHLKHNRKIIFWPYVASTAAVFILALLFFIPSEGNNTVRVASKTPVPQTPEPTSIIVAPTTPTKNNSNTSQNPTLIASVNSQNKTASPDVRPAIMETINTLERKEIQQINTSVKNELLPFIITENSDISKDEYSSAFNNMENPIKTVTHILSNRTNKEVDFRKTKKSSKKEKGFFLKIGNFEISRKKYR